MGKAQRWGGRMGKEPSAALDAGHQAHSPAAIYWELDAEGRPVCRLSRVSRGCLPEASV
jgi:hypothetical protein